MSHPVSPLAPTHFPVLSPVNGVRIATTSAGIRYKNRTDLLMMEFSEGTQVAGVLTTSLTASAPVLACRESLKDGKARALIVNSGNSNAFTGKAGVAAVERVARSVCAMMDCKPHEVYMASTGVIGETLPDEKITVALPAMRHQFSDSAWIDAARAIMTTDTYPKMATRTCVLNGADIRINGIAKGSGMIAPDMATMLAFVFTDANIPAALLQVLLSEANAKTFNCITVDGDTSTSDTLLLFATSKAKHLPPANIQDPALAAFRLALHDVLHELSLLVVKDGEGAEKLMTIKVSGAENETAARRIGMSIANSPLVKTAIAASDANWGRIVMAVGKAGERADRDKLAIVIGGVSVAKDGAVDPHYHEAQIRAHMQGRDILIDVDVGIGSASCTVYSCDLTHRYVDINGSYRT